MDFTPSAVLFYRKNPDIAVIDDDCSLILLVEAKTHGNMVLKARHE